MAAAMSAVLARSQASYTAWQAMAVMIWVPLIRARPSLAASWMVSMPAAAMASRPGITRP